jgi:hypothetical protein
MEEWDPANNNFVLRCNSAGEEITSMSKSSVPHVKNIIGKDI